MARRKARTDAWYCTDECVRWFGGLMFSPITKRKFAVTDVKMTADRIRTSFNSLREYLHVYDRNESLSDLVPTGGRFPDMKTPNKTADFKGRTISKSKKTFKRKCDDVRKKGDTPLGYVVGVKPTRAKARSERKEKGYDLRAYSADVTKWILEEGGTGHAVAVDCEGRTVADTAPSYTKRKKIRTVRQINLVGWLRNWYLHFTPATVGYSTGKRARGDDFAIWRKDRNW